MNVNVFRVPFLVAVALAVAFGGGLWSTIWALQASSGFGAIRVGTWIAFPQAQTADADPYAKSHRARAGKLLYGGAEAVAFTSLTDDDGQPLSGNCHYTISGTTPTARLWTLFATDISGQPLLTEINLPSAINSRTVLRQPDGSFVIEVATTARPGNWLAITAANRFGLSLTLLDTPAAGNSGLTALDMPRIARNGCGNG